MATKSAHKRLTKEYAMISKNPVPGIDTHPSDADILTWHYILHGPDGTPYKGGQYWGTLTFPPDYPFAPPAIRMHTPSGRFQPSARLCLSISDFHPKSFNPAWSVSTILLGLQSFMTSDEMTTGSVSATPAERQLFAYQSRWWNSTGGGSSPRTIPGIGGSSNVNGRGNVKAGDGGDKFRREWAELDEQNWAYMKEKRIDTKTGRAVVDPASASCTPGADALKRVGNSSGGGIGVVGQQAREAGQGWVGSHKVLVVVVVVVAYAFLARLLRD